MIVATNKLSTIQAFLGLVVVASCLAKAAGKLSANHVTYYMAPSSYARSPTADCPYKGKLINIYK